MAPTRTDKLGAFHDLSAVKEAVRHGRLSWQDSVNDDLDKWGYEVDEVVQCLLALEPGDFRKTHEYTGNPDPRGRGTFDDYCLPWTHRTPEGKTYREVLYIKLKLTKSGRAVFLLSFHPSNG